MLTRSQARIGKQAELIKAADEQNEVVKKSGKSVRLTEDLLYIVNKKLRAMDKAARNEEIHDFYSDGFYPDSQHPFTEVVYRKRNFPELSQTQLAVMHKANFDLNSTAVCKLNSMSEFFYNITRAKLAAKSKNFRTFLKYNQRDASTPVKNAPARFIQLPKDYFRPHSDCHFFAELAWKENGIMMVDADNFALCLIIWRLKEWLVNPIENKYPVCCQFDRRENSCVCQNLLHAMRTDNRLRKFLEGRTIFEVNVLELILDEMKNFAKKLITGEEMISQSNRAENVLSALQMDRIIDKFESIIECFYRMLYNIDTRFREDHPRLVVDNLINP